MLNFTLSRVTYETGGVKVLFRRISKHMMAESLLKHGLDDNSQLDTAAGKHKSSMWYLSFITECLVGIEGLCDCETGDPIVYDDMTVEQRESFIGYLLDEDDGFSGWVSGYMAGAKKKPASVDEGLQ